MDIYLFNDILSHAMLHWHIYAHQQKVERPSFQLVGSDMSLRCNGFSVLLARYPKLLYIQTKRCFLSSRYLKVMGRFIWRHQNRRVFYYFVFISSIDFKHDNIPRSIASNPQPFLREVEKREVLLGLYDFHQFPHDTCSYTLILLGAAIRNDK